MQEQDSRTAFKLRLRQGLAVGFSCALLLVAVRALNRLEPVEKAVADTLFQFRGGRTPSSDILIVAANDEDTAEYGWPIRRSNYGKIIDRFKAAGARTFAFDILLPQDSTDYEDNEFSKSLRSSGNVVHAANIYLPDQIDPMALKPTRSGTPFPTDGADNTPLPIKFGFPPPSDFQCLNAASAFTAYPMFIQSAAGLGHVRVFPEWDGALRRVPNIVSLRQRVRGTNGAGDSDNVSLFPSLAVATAIHFLGVPQKGVLIRPGEIVLEPPANATDNIPRRIPINADGETMINWVGPYRSFTTISLKDATKYDTKNVRGKVIIFGISATGAFERHATPYAPSIDAVEAQANALDDILQNRVLREAPGWMQLALLVLLPVLAGVIVAGKNAKINALVFATICFGVYTASGMLLSWADFYLPVGGAILGAAMSCTVAIFLRQSTDAHQLRLADERYSLAVRGANDGLWDWHLKENSIYFSPRWKEMMGCTDDEIGTSPEDWFKRVHPEDVGPLRDVIKAHLAGKLPHFDFEYRMRHKTGVYRWMLTRGMVVRGANDRPVRMAGSHTDITGRKNAEKKLAYNAFYDLLTGLPNRALFVTRLEQAIGRAQRKTEYCFAVLFMDLDRFKNINDSLGHAAGDEMIKEMGRRITACLRMGDTPARLGSDEFTVLLDDITDASDANRVAERFQTELSRPLSILGHDVVPSISVGITLSTTGYNNANDMLRDADIAVARAKSLGTGRREIFDTAMHDRAVHLLRLESDLRRAMERESFVVYYQAIVALRSGKLAGFESLARWQHHTRGLVSPGEFIPLAEDTGLITSIDQWVLRRSCEQMNEWQQEAGGVLPLFLSVNLSSKQFSQPDLVEQVAETISSTSFEPRRLKLEITESAIMDNADNAASMLLQLREMGIQLSIDDFGTGYSSLSYLHRFPLDTLKIDQSFVARMGDSGEVEIVRAIITLAKNLAMSVVAEGVETEEQLKLLRELGCDYGQGYYFSRPVTAADAFKLLQSNTRW